MTDNQGWNNGFSNPSNQNRDTQSAPHEYQASHMPNWGYGAPIPPPGKPRRSGRKALKVIAAGLAVVVIGFGSGYLGSVAASSSRSGGLLEAPAQPPVLNTSTASENTDGSESLVQKVAGATANSVVEITTEGVVTDAFYRQSIQSGAGSGVIISADGYIVTNHHVVADSSKITVTLRDGSQYTAALIGTDSKTDVAVIKVDAENLQPAVLGDSSTLQVGEPAIVIGNPLGQLGGTVTNGIISALDRQITVDGQSMTLLQTNAAINPGNSGGALFNERGELVGIVNSKTGGTSGGTTIEGLGFAIPINIAKPVIEDLITFGYVQGRISLGITTLDINDAITAMLYGLNSTGVYIAQVESGSNAEKAGLRSGDRILSLNGSTIESSSQITAILDGCSIGDQVTILISRGGRQGQATLVLEEYKGQGLSI